MYLSRLILNPRSRAVWRDLADCHEMHRTIMSAFPEVSKHEGSPREQYGALHRVEIDDRSGVISLFVQASLCPDWSKLEHDYLADTNGEMENPASKPVAEQYGSIKPGTILAFRLKANPTRKIDTKTGPDGKRHNGKRVELRREKDQIEWLRRKGQQGGFELLSAKVSPEVPDVKAVMEPGLGKVTGRRGPTREGDKAHRLTLASVLFGGHLRVTDSEKFLNVSLAQGIGSGKAFGFGLLSIAPAMR